MDSQNQLRRLQRILVDRKVTFRRLAGNSLLVYLECKPGNNKEGYVVWFEPCWHFCGPTKVLVGSYQPELTARSHQVQVAGFKKIAPLLDKLIGRKIVSIQIEPRSNDLRVLFKGGYELKTFVDDPTYTYSESWHITDNASGLGIYGSPSGMEVEKKRWCQKTGAVLNSVAYPALRAAQ